MALDNTNLVNRAKIALSLGQRSEAKDFWQEAIARYPHFARESADAIKILLGLERFDEADAVILDRQCRKPGEVAHAREYALISQRRGDTEVALRRWAEVRRKFPLEWMGYVCGAMCLRKAGQIEAAEELQRKSLDLFPNKLEAWVESAHTAEHQSDWPESMRRWQIVSAKFRHVTADIGIARALEELGRIAEAEQRLLARQGLSTGSGNPYRASPVSRTAWRQGNRPAALGRHAAALPVASGRLSRTDRPAEADGPRHRSGDGSGRRHQPLPDRAMA